MAASAEEPTKEAKVNGVGHGAEFDEEEPRLKYEKLGSDVDSILADHEASCLCVSDKMLAMGTHSGTVHLLSTGGDEVKRFEAHTRSVRDLCFDESAEFIGSCSDDGSVVIQSLCTDDVATFNYGRPLKTIALDPRYRVRKTRQFVTGGLAGELVLNTRGWLWRGDDVLHAGEGQIQIARWHDNFIAWASNVSVKVYDASIHKEIGIVERPRGTLPSPSTECRLFWSPDGLLVIGWAKTITVASVNCADPGTGATGSIAIMARFDIDGIISGVSMFCRDLVVLVYVKNQDSQDDLNNGSQVEASRPELRNLMQQNEEISSDALSIPGYEHYEANDYSLATWYPSAGSRQSPATSPSGTYFSRWWPEGEEPTYYVVSSKYVVVGKPQDEHDRVEWLLQHGKYEKALSVGRLLRKQDSKTWDEVVDRYVEHLFQENKFLEAAEMCHDLLGNDGNRWEKYIYRFARRRHLGTFSSYIPTENPTLKPSAYNMVLRSCIPSPSSHRKLLELVQSWPPSVYSVQDLARDVNGKLSSVVGDRSVLEEVLARLYILQSMHDKALDIYLQLQRPEVFEFIVQHALLRSLPGKISALITLDEEKALDLLVQSAQEVDPSKVVEEMQAAMEKCKEQGMTEKYVEWRKRLFRYLDRLVSDDMMAAPEHHGLLVELYADYDISRLMQFLKSSHQYPLDHAYFICNSKKFIKEQVYILGRMGNTHGALQLIIKELEDIPQAIDFAKNQNDNELWDSLIEWAVGSAATTGALLDHVGGHVDPLRVITRIPHGMEITNLRNRLCRIIADYRTQTSLQEGCNNILRADCVHLAEKLYKEIRCAIPTLYMIARPADSPTSDLFYRYTTSSGDALATPEPTLGSVSTLSQRSKSLDLRSPPTSSRDTFVGVRMGFLIEKSGQGDGELDASRFRYARKSTSAMRHAAQVAEMPSLVQ